MTNEVGGADPVKPAQDRNGRAILGDLVHYRTYAATKPNGKKETRAEVIDRVKSMHQTKFPWLADQIEDAFKLVHSGHAVPSMRTMQFGGMPIFRSNARAYNCAFAALTNWKDFADLFWLLMNGVGTGYSVQRHHVEQLPAVTSHSAILRVEKTFVVPDTKEGWADALLAVLEDYRTKLDTSLVRPKGAPISSGGTASGPEALVEMLDKVRAILAQAHGRKLTSYETFQIMCHVAQAVVVGGVRRAATIALFDADDEQMLSAKSGAWYVEHPEFARANISAVLERHDPHFETKLRNILKHTFASGAGEPGISLTNDREYGFNPCHEISLRDGQLCNLTEVNAAACATQGEFIEAVKTATIIGTLQASYTQFDYLQPKWRENCEKDALLGVSITGQAEAWPLLTSNIGSWGSLLNFAASYARYVNRLWAEKLDIRPAARLTTTKPSGNTSAWLNATTSGIHAAHSDYFLRRVRVDRKDAFGQFLIDTFGEEPAESYSFVESDKFDPENIIVTVPVKMADGTRTRAQESAVDLMERAKFVQQHWIQPGHVTGPNTHNVSLTVTYTPDEEKEVADWMVANAEHWAGISLLPYDGGTYVQSPFEEVTEEEYTSFMAKLPENVDFSSIDFSDAVDERLGELACAGGACEVR